jgi:hypothetical protein
MRRLKTRKWVAKASKRRRRRRRKYSYSCTSSDRMLSGDLSPDILDPDTTTW